MVIHIFVLGTSLYFYDSHNLSVHFHFSSLFTNPKRKPRIPHLLLYSALITIPLLIVAPSHCIVVVLSHCNTTATSHYSNHFVQVLPLVASIDPFFSSYEPLKLESLNSLCFMNVYIWFLYVSLLFAVTPYLEVEFCDYIQVGYWNWLKIEFWVLIFYCFSCGRVLEC